MRWLLSLQVYTVTFLSTLGTFAQQPQLFATFTNIAYLLPLFVLAVDPFTTNFMPTVLFLCIFLAFGSFIHHYHVCANPNYRVLDHISYLLLYTYLLTRSFWIVACPYRIGRAITRFVCVVTLAFLICFYEQVLANNEGYVLAFGIVSAIVIFGDSIFILKRESLRGGLLTVLICVALIVLAAAFNGRISVSEDKYDLFHGMWHICAAQFQFVLIFTLLTRQKLSPEFFEMGLTVVAIIVFSFLRGFEIYSAWVFLLVSLLLTIVATWRLLRVANPKIHIGKTRWRISCAKQEIDTRECA